MKRRSILLWFVILAISPLILWISSLIKCEILTQKYYDDFRYAYQSNSMLGDMEYFKVLRCDENTAEVYYVSEGMTDANLLTFKKQGSAWMETEWSTVWSSTGSASGIVYPYWWHFSYGGF